MDLNRRVNECARMI